MVDNKRSGSLCVLADDGQREEEGKGGGGRQGGLRGPRARTGQGWVGGWVGGSKGSRTRKGHDTTDIKAETRN